MKKSLKIDYLRLSLFTFAFLLGTLLLPQNALGSDTWTEHAERFLTRHLGYQEIQFVETETLDAAGSDNTGRVLTYKVPQGIAKIRLDSTGPNRREQAFIDIQAPELGSRLITLHENRYENGVISQTKIFRNDRIQLGPGQIHYKTGVLGTYNQEGILTAKEARIELVSATLDSLSQIVADHPHLEIEYEVDPMSEFNKAAYSSVLLDSSKPWGNKLLLALPGDFDPVHMLITWLKQEVQS